jgi:hypothetical protein
MVNMNLADKELFLRNTREIDRYIYIERERLIILDKQICY